MVVISPLLMSRENPDGRTLEDVLQTMIAEIGSKSVKLANDDRSEAKMVLANNATIVALLKQALVAQEHSMKALEAIGPNEGPRGKPRIGPGSRVENGAVITDRPDLAYAARHGAEEAGYLPARDALQKGGLLPGAGGTIQQPEPPHAAEQAATGLHTR